MEQNFHAPHYRLQSLVTGRIFEDTGWILDDEQSDKPGLLRTIYDTRQLTLKEESLGLYQFADWLPVHEYLKGSSAPVTYRSEHLARHLGLTNLWITFSGYWPERGASMRTCSFKETEAYAVCGRLDHQSDGNQYAGTDYQQYLYRSSTSARP